MRLRFVIFGVLIGSLGCGTMLGDNHREEDQEMLRRISAAPPTSGAPGAKKRSEAEDLAQAKKDGASIRETDALAVEAPTPASRCIETRKISWCAPIEVGKKNECIQTCIDGLDRKREEEASRAEADCESRLVAADGKGTFTCGLAPEGPAEDVKKVSAEFSAALKSGDKDRMDVASARAFAIDRQRSEVSCSKKCNADGKDRMRANADGPDLVTKYKQCMVKADSTHEARKLAVYERDLYCGVLRKADTKCRELSKCDWLEGLSAGTCSYASPGLELGMCTGRE
jgi:hypothetical protein